MTTLIIDLDDTLIATQSKYIECKEWYKNTFGELAVKISDEIDLDRANKHISNPRHRFIESYIYGQIEAFGGYSSKNELRIKEKFQEILFTNFQFLGQNIPKVLKTLKKEFYTILYTLGDEDIQKSKITALKLDNYFHQTIITPNKDKSNLYAAVDSAYFHTDDIFVIGDSIKSDIIPAIQNGFTPIHINNGLGWAYDNQISIDMSSILQFSTFELAAEYLLEKK